MVYVDIPEESRLLSFYLSMEEYVARTKPAESEYFFMWQVEPSVIFGRNQLIENEVNIPYCRSHGIRMYRRKSGGGCVYADMSNIMFAYITPDENVSLTFNKYIDLVVGTLRKLGVPAEASGRNDILIHGRKVSGNAFYHIPGRSIVHGTMLYDTNMQNMVSAITPSDEKLVSKGVKSVRQHIALLKDYIPLSLKEFKDFVRNDLCESSIMLNADDISNIKEIEREYLSDEFIYGNNPRYSIINRKRIENVGDMEARIELKNGIIKDVNIMGDYFLVGDIDNRILYRLRNIPYTREALEAVIPPHVDDIVMNLKRDELIGLLLNS
ncbi:MAG: lipoate--protein ligase [Prevotella sp.]|nr:lipoate--protein ligase [Prevotella sp.]